MCCSCSSVNICFENTCGLYRFNSIVKVVKSRWI
jgi:hypothetical protein